MTEYKQVILVRQDLKLTKGKMAAQHWTLDIRARRINNKEIGF
jgi:peptidyl-tRNA hydrolase